MVICANYQFSHCQHYKLDPKTKNIYDPVVIMTEMLHPTYFDIFLTFFTSLFQDCKKESAMGGEPSIIAC